MSKEQQFLGLYWGIMAYPEIADGKTIVFACGYPKAEEKDKILKAKNQINKNHQRQRH